MELGPALDRQGQESLPDPVGRADHSSHTCWKITPARPTGGFAAGLALVLVAVLVGVAAQRVTGGEPATTAVSGVAATGHTTTVHVVADGMRFHPDRIEVPTGDRLVIELTNHDHRRHDLVLATGARTPPVARGGSARLDAGVVGAATAGWCSLSGHRQAGMTQELVPTGAVSPPAATPPAAAPHRTGPLDPMAAPDPSFTARDAGAPPTPTGRLHRRELHVREVQREVAPGVRQRMWTFDGLVPGPVLRGKVGIPVYAALLAVNAGYAWRRRERALLNDLASVALSCLLLFVVATVAGVPPVRVLPAFVALLLYLAGTVLYVKTMIRERGSARYLRFSIGYHRAAPLPPRAGRGRPSAGRHSPGSHRSAADRMTKVPGRRRAER